MRIYDCVCVCRMHTPIVVCIDNVTSMARRKRVGWADCVCVCVCGMHISIVVHRQYYFDNNEETSKLG
jgi:hypothetical protein